MQGDITLLFSKAFSFIFRCVYKRKFFLLNVFYNTCSTVSHLPHVLCYLTWYLHDYVFVPICKDRLDVVDNYQLNQ